MKSDMLTLMDGSKLPRDQVLGVITISTVPDEFVSGAKLSKLWAAEGLDPKLIPKTRKPVDTFSQACRKVETRRGTANGRQVEVKVDEVEKEGPSCIYQITRMERDKTNHVIVHTNAMTLVLDKVKAEAGDPDPIDVIPQDKTTFGELKGLADNIIAWYKKNLAMVPGQKIRNALRDYMEILGAENLRRKSGGVYFVPTSGVDTLESLQRVLEALYGGNADLDIFAQPKTKFVAKMLEKHHALNVKGECDDLIARISTRLKASSNKVRKDLLTNIMQERRELGARRKQMAEILGHEIKELNGHFEVLDEQIENLMGAAL